MGILQEYKFYLIIAVIALVFIIQQFFGSQKQGEYTNFLTNLQANFSQVKGVASDSKTLKSVVTVDGSNIKGLKNNSLFGLAADGDASSITLIDEFDGTKWWDDAHEPTVGANKYRITFATTSPFTNSYAADGTASAATDGSEDVTVVAGIPSDADSVDKGWDLDTNGYVIYTFENTNQARKIIDQYLPEGTLLMKADGTTPSASVAVKLIPNR